MTERCPICGAYNPINIDDSLEKLENLSKSLRVLRLPVKAQMVDEVLEELRQVKE